MSSALELRQLQFGSVLEAAAHDDFVARSAAASAAQETSSFHVRCFAWVSAVLSSRLAQPVAVFLLASLVLVALCPPFVLTFHYDATRPWKGTSALSWSSVFVVAFATALCATLAPKIAPFIPSS